MDEKEAFLKALELDGEPRAEFLAEVCRDDEMFCNRIEELLRSHAEGDSRLTNPYVVEATSADQPDEDRAVEYSLEFLEPTERAESLGRLESTKSSK